MKNSGQNEFRMIRGAATSLHEVTYLMSPECDMRINFSLTNMADRYIAMTGGEDLHHACIDNHRYDLIAKKWEVLPDRRFGIKRHGSCCIDGNLYIFCGLGRMDQAFNTI